MPSIALPVSLRGQLLSGTRTSPAFSPLSLFAASEPGVWYDPSDLTTMFQDIAGTTPVTTPGQTVARINDKSGRGNNATQATTASRPTYGIVPLGGRRNLLTFSEQFDNAAWTKNNATVTANASVAPDGTTTADRTVENSGSITNVGVTSPIVGTVAGNIFTTPYTYSVYAKEVVGSAKRYIVIGIGGTTRWGYVIADLASGTITQTSIDGIQTAASGTISPPTDGWRRVSVTFSSPLSSGFYTLRTCMSSSPTLTFTSGDIPSYTGDGTSGIFIWGAQLELGSTATAYQRVTTQYDVTEAGVQSLSYLSFDGVDDSLVTPTITPGINKVQVFAGVRKLSDASTGLIAELSANASGGGAFVVYAPSNSGQGDYFIGSAGTIGIGIDTPNTFVAPITNVYTGLLDISAPSAIIRINSVQSASSTATQGTGNYLAYPLYIGRRGGTTLPFNGQIYNMIVRFGANLDAGTIISTETFVNGKTGAY